MKLLSVEVSATRNIQQTHSSKMSADPDSVTPPEGQLSFSGIPEAQFVEDVDSHMAGEDNAEHKLKVRAVAF